ncbi:GrlR family regulatory protein [Anaeroarcus burkinensis]|uniref:GrlR family regulatory protein n=1 Tax=Anaeroarcus burkinensis TaxID=82376 RepID=UPI000568500C|nr:GrlR family regulatory protein [Anaeroarcus burkinensis]
MLEGLWSVEFKTASGYVGAGVVVFETRKIFGGSDNYYYLGNYKTERDGKVIIETEIVHYSGAKTSPFGNLDQYNAIWEGYLSGETSIFEGHLQHDPLTKVNIRLIKRAELP